MAEPARFRLRAVAFQIDGKVFEGKPGETHGSLYAHLRRDRIVPAGKLDFWTAREDDHGFVTDKGEFVNRVETLKRFGVRRSQDLSA